MGFDSGISSMYDISNVSRFSSLRFISHICFCEVNFRSVLETLGTMSLCGYSWGGGGGRRNTSIQANLSKSHSIFIFFLRRLDSLRKVFAQLFLSRTSEVRLLYKIVR